MTTILPTDNIPAMEHILSSEHRRVEFGRAPANTDGFEQKLKAGKASVLASKVGGAKNYYI